MRRECIGRAKSLLQIQYRNPLSLPTPARRYSDWTGVVSLVLIQQMRRGQVRDRRKNDWVLPRRRSLLSVVHSFTIATECPIEPQQHDRVEDETL
jgi:hypothetical protein